MFFAAISGSGPATVAAVGGMVIPSMLEADVEKAIRERVEDGCGNLYVLVNYTALFSTRNVLKKMEEER